MTPPPLAALGKVGTVIMGLSPQGESVTTDSTAGLPLLNGPTEFGPVHPTPRQWALQWAREAEPGDTLFCVRGSTTGRMNTAQMRYAIGRGIAAIRGATPVDTAYIRYALVEGLSDLLSLTSGSVFPNISAGDLKGVELPWPDEQTRVGIARVLGGIDARIDSNRRAIQIASEMLDALASKVAGDLPTTTLGAIVKTAKSSINPAQLGDVYVDHYSLPAFDASARPERVPASVIMSGKQVIAGRSILLSRLNPRTNRTWWVAPCEGIRALASNEFSCLTAEDDLALAGVWLAVRDEFFRSELTQRVTGTSGSHQRVRPDDLLSIDVPDVRSLKIEHKRMALTTLELIEQRRDEIAGLAEVLAVLRPELLAGRMRAPDALGAVA